MAKEESKVVKYLDSKVEIKTKPPVGENVPIYIRPLDKIDLQALGINLETANFKLIGGDMVLDVPGGGSFTFVSLALMGYCDSQPEFLGAGGKLVSLGTILSNIEEVNAIPVSSVVTNEFVNMPPATPEEIKKEKVSQVILSDNNPSTEEKSNIDESIADSTAQQQNSGEAEVNENIAMQTKTKSQTKTEDSKVEGIAPTLTFDIDVQHVEIRESTSYDADGKTLTVYGGGGVFIFLFKIGKLNQVESMNGTNRTDDFILSTVTNIKNIINTYKDNTITFYRFNGSEFILLAREWNYLEAVDFADRILNTLNDKVVNSYKLPTNIFHIGGTPIDKYGTTDLIMKSLNEAYTEAVSKGGNSYKILEESEIKKKTEDTEATIIKLIKENSFGITFSFNSYSFDNQLLIRELKPILEDEQGNTLQIGSFISISEKLGLNVKFDEEVILKALDYAKENKIDYKIAVNLSIRTIANFEFMEFLEDLVDKDKNVVNHILFSITSYSAFAYKQEFKIFVEKLNELNFKILMKRYKPTDYPFEKLSEVKIDYMKIDKELIKNINNDLIKKHKMRNIVVFADVNNIKLMVENIESDKDYEFLSKLDLYTVDK